MFIDGLVNADSLPTLEKVVSFAGQRSKVIANNIANFSTPNYREKKVDTASFQAALGKAVDKRREQFGGHRGQLNMQSTKEVQVGANGRLTLTPRELPGNVLFHDRNNRDLDRTMQAMAENVAVFRTATDLFRTRVGLLNQAISERV